jgi:malate synthase
MTLSQTLQGFEDILTPEALGFVRDLVREFSLPLESLLRTRILVHERLRNGTLPDFLDETREIRTSEWKVGSIPTDLRQRRVEITGPVDRKMVINALNSGADVYMADFEDSHSPTWNGTLQGQVNLRDAVDRIITYTNPDGREYKLAEKPGTLFVRPRGLHMTEKHIQFDSKPTPPPSSTMVYSSTITRRNWPGEDQDPTYTSQSWKATRKPASGTTSSTIPRRR